MLDDILRERIEEKGHNNFWDIFDSLSLYGYPAMDSLGAALTYYKESEIWKDVAYGKVKKIVNERERHIFGVDPFYGDHRDTTQHHRANPPVDIVLEVGMIDGKNQHLLGLFDFYRKSLVEGKVEFNDDLIQEIEDNCSTKYIFSQLPQFVMLYLVDTSKKHFGYNLLDRARKSNLEI